MDMFTFVLIYLSFLKKKEFSFLFSFSILLSLFNLSWTSMYLVFHFKMVSSMFLLTSIVMMMSYSCVQNMNIFLSLTSIFSVIFFSSSIFIFLFVFFEMSLIPILMIILLWGIQPERFSAFYFLLLYTMFSSMPLFFSILLMTNQNIMMFWFVSMFSLFSFSFAFMVKLPAFFFHIWLPKAHVEAPTLGSILLAGLLLKLGGFGLVIILNIFMNSMSIILLMIISFGSIFSSIFCCLQSDSKSLVALSSVCHLNFMFFILMTMMISGKVFNIMTMIIHGINSSFMFWIAGTMFHINQTRNMIWLNNISLLSSSLFTMVIVVFISNFGIPPLISFFQEIFFFSIMMFMNKKLWIVGILYILIVCYFSLFFLTSINNKKNFFCSETFVLFEIFGIIICLWMMNFFLLFLI